LNDDQVIAKHERIVIDNIKNRMTFSNHTGLKGVIEEFMSLRQQAILDENKELRNFLKLCLNSPYGQEIINEEKFTKIVLCNSHQVLIKHLNTILHTVLSIVTMFINAK
jgi:hypothetical protein